MSGREQRRIVAMGGGGFLMEDDPTLDDQILALTGRARPKVCFVPTATADGEPRIERFTDMLAGRAETSVLRLFRRSVVDLRAFVLSQDVIYVSGGNTANLLAIWRVHGLDVVMREAWERGVLLCGPSAGAICWFEAGVTDSFGPLRELHGGLGLLPGSFCPHYDGEVERRPTFLRLVAEGTLPGGYAADDGAALLFEGARVARVLRARPTTRAFRVDRVGDDAREEALG